MSEIILDMRNITKVFPGVKALDNVNLKVRKGEIHALVGENGDGKSTLMNVLSGIYPYGTYLGDIFFEGKKCEFKSVRDSEKAGIGIIHQELALNPYMSIAENIFLCNERSKYGIINWDRTYQEARKLMAKVGLKEKYNTLVMDIGVGKQQLVEIAKALSKDVRLLILDEPTAALNDRDSDNLLNLLLELNQQGLTCIIISHKIHEVTRIADRITIIRDGSIIETLVKGVDEFSENRIIKGMVGRELVNRFPPKEKAHIGEVGFEVKDWVVYDPLDDERMRIKHVSFNVRKGEIVGIAGLMGAGRTELVMSLFGRAYGKKISGTILKDGKKLVLKTVHEAIKAGIAYATEDRKTAGLILIDDIRRNITLPRLDKVSRNSVIDEGLEVKIAEEQRRKLNIRSSGVYQKTGNLSGGNQQKVVLSKWIFSEPDVLFLDEPTRGIDVGAKYEIYTIINQLASQGKCIVMISSELPEILGICDRIYVMNEGSIVGEMSREEASPEKIMKCILNSTANKG
ncbi:MAG: ATP-binding cassette domain-containing protein [Clostridiaceae bacterium]|nr:ATP-binding cassette domain-containing protein [Clostridiaceae bacterium]